MSQIFPQGAIAPVPALIENRGAESRPGQFHNALVAPMLEAQRTVIARLDRAIQ
jgi:hypothetical protein